MSGFVESEREREKGFAESEKERFHRVRERKVVEILLKYI